MKTNYASINYLSFIFLHVCFRHSQSDLLYFLILFLLHSEKKYATPALNWTRVDWDSMSDQPPRNVAAVSTVREQEVGLAGGLKDSCGSDQSNADKRAAWIIDSLFGLARQSRFEKVIKIG